MWRARARDGRGNSGSPPKAFSAGERKSRLGGGFWVCAVGGGSHHEGREGGEEVVAVVGAYLQHDGLVEIEAEDA